MAIALRPKHNDDERVSPPLESFYRGWLSGVRRRRDTEERSESACLRVRFYHAVLAVKSEEASKS
jgi:hypothetical protein